jgi:hypothetical protein
LRHRRRQKLHQVGGIASVERQVQDALVVHHLADAEIAGFDGERARLDRHGLLDLPHRHSDDDGRRRTDLQHDAGLRVRPEALQRGLETVRTNGEIRQQELPLRIGDCVAFEARVGLRHGDINAGQHTSASVFHGPADLSGRAGLRPDGRGGQ